MYLNTWFGLVLPIAYHHLSYLFLSMLLSNVCNKNFVKLSYYLGYLFLLDYISQQNFFFFKYASLPNENLTKLDQNGK